MTQFHRFFLLISLIFAALILTGCEKEADIEPTTATPAFPDRTPPGPPIFAEVHQTFFATENNTNNDLALTSFDPSNPDAAAEIIQLSNNAIMYSLNLESGKVTIAVNNNSVFSIDHESDEIRRLSHFANPICEVLPAETVASTEDATDIVLTTVNAPLVYIVTTSSLNSSGCSDPNQPKQYQKLPFNFLFDASDLNEDFTVSIETVSEAEARSQLVFGWVEDEETSEQVLDYGYLGYSFDERSLRFYDKDRELVWSQDRTVQTFDIENLPNGEESPRYIALTRHLQGTNYVLQLGLDIFVFDATDALFPQNNVTARDVFSDRNLHLTPDATTNNAEINAPQVTQMVFDDTNILFINDSKIFHLSYSQSTPVTSKTYSIVDPFKTADSMEFSGHLPFSQFDIVNCANHNDPTNCSLASDPEPLTNPDWQFITDCEAVVGCEFPTPDVSNCVIVPTGADDEVLCSTSEYTHLDELDDPGNDVEFRGFMQYESDFMRGKNIELYDDSLLITARMPEHDVLLRYYYNIDLLAPKSSREQVLLGSNTAHQNISSIIDEDNLYITSLVSEGQKRFNECYKDNRRVLCDLQNLEEGSSTSCTRYDLDAGLCVDFYEIYTSQAYFCTLSQVESDLCTDRQLSGSDSISVVEDGFGAKWVPITSLDDQTQAVDDKRLFLLRGDESEVIDEGVLINAELLEFDADLAEIGSVVGGGGLGTVSRVEDVLNTNLYINGSLARMDVITNEPLNVEADNSTATTYFITDPDNASVSNIYEVGSRSIRP